MTFWYKSIFTFDKFCAKGHISRDWMNKKDSTPTKSLTTSNMELAFWKSFPSALFITARPTVILMRHVCEETFFTQTQTAVAVTSDFSIAAYSVFVLFNGSSIFGRKHFFIRCNDKMMGQ